MYDWEQSFLSTLNWSCVVKAMNYPEDALYQKDRQSNPFLDSIEAQRVTCERNCHLIWILWNAYGRACKSWDKFKLVIGTMLKNLKSDGAVLHFNDFWIGREKSKQPFQSFLFFSKVTVDLYINSQLSSWFHTVCIRFLWYCTHQIPVALANLCKLEVFLAYPLLPNWTSHIYSHIIFSESIIHHGPY